MKFARSFAALSTALLVTSLAGPAAAQDLERGKEVYKRIGNCRRCHGWNGNGLGKNPRAPGPAAKLRQSKLDAKSLNQIIQCGIPGTAMPYHDQNAYRDDRCYGMTSDDFEPGQKPDEGNIFRASDRKDVVAYLQKYIIGAGETTLADCQRFYSEGADQCEQLRE